MGRRLPDWLRVSPAGGEPAYARVRARLRDHQLHTVCEEARCPNRAECWGEGTATLLLLGDVCTRSCRFCAVRSGDPGGRIEDDEAERAARTVVELGLDYVVLTSVDRDDLPDGGASVYAAAARAIRRAAPGCRVEALIPDFGGDRSALAAVVEAPIVVIGHNVEVVRRLTRRARDARASYDRSLAVLAGVEQLDPDRWTKSSLMLGLGEREEEILETMRDLLSVGVDLLTLGQYLQPTARQLPVVDYVTPERFARLGEMGEEMGFRHVAAGPLVRSSHRARSQHDAAGEGG